MSEKLPLFNFNYKKILSYCEDIQSLKKQIDYLSYVLEMANYSIKVSGHWGLGVCTIEAIFPREIKHKKLLLDHENKTLKPDHPGEPGQVTDQYEAKQNKIEIKSIIDYKGNSYTKTKFCQMLYENMKLGRSVFKAKDCNNKDIEIKTGQRKKQDFANYISGSFIYKGNDFDSNTVKYCLKTYSLKPEDESFLKKVS